MSAAYNIALIKLIASIIICGIAVSLIVYSFVFRKKYSNTDLIFFITILCIGISLLLFDVSNLMLKSFFELKML